MTSRNIATNAAISELAFTQVDTLPHGFTTEDWMDLALELFQQYDEVANVRWFQQDGEIDIWKLEYEVEDLDYVKIAKECMARAWDILVAEAIRAKAGAKQ